MGLNCEIKIRCLLYFLFSSISFAMHYHLTTSHWGHVGFIFSTDQSAMSLLFACQELSSDWLIYLTVLHTIGHSKMNESLSDITLNKLLDVSVSPR